MEDDAEANSQRVRVEIGIEEALASLQQVSFEQFIAKKEEIDFKVSISSPCSHTLLNAASRFSEDN